MNRKIMFLFLLNFVSLLHYSDANNGTEVPVNDLYIVVFVVIKWLLKYIFRYSLISSKIFYFKRFLWIMSAFLMRLLLRLYSNPFYWGDPHFCTQVNHPNNDYLILNEFLISIENAMNNNYDVNYNYIFWNSC